MPPKKAAEPAMRASARVKTVAKPLPAPTSKATTKNARQSAAPAPATKRKTADEDSPPLSVKQTKTAPNTGRKIAPLKATVTKATTAKTTTKKAAATVTTSAKATAAKETTTKETAKETTAKATTAKSTTAKPTKAKATTAKAASTKQATKAPPVSSAGPTIDKRKATDEDTSDRPAKKANINGAIKPKASHAFRIPRRGPSTVINEAPLQKLNVYVFGEGASGELGLGSARTAVDVKRPRLNPNLAADKVGVVQIATGGMHAIALTHDSRILTWGVNDLGAVGRDTKWEGGLRDISDGNSDDDSDDDGSDSGMNPKESTPAEVPTQYFEEGTKFVQVVAGDSASFALTDEGFVYGWGTFRNNEGTLGFSPDSLVQFTPTYVPGLKKIKSIAMGNNHALALDHKGNVFAWGSGQQHQLGRRLVERTAAGGLIPREFGLPKNKIKFIGCGSYHSFAIDNNSKVWAWGANSYCETGIQEGLGGDNSVVVKPKLVESLQEYDIEYIAGGDHHSLAVTKDGDLLVWGRLDGFQIGVKVEDIPRDYITRDDNGIPRIIHKPIKINGLKVSMAAAGSDNNIAITTDGQAYSWGFSANYQTGQGTHEDIEVATRIDNSAVRGKHLTWAGCGGQYSILAAPAEDVVMVNGEREA